METVVCPVCDAKQTVRLAGTMPKQWHAAYFGPGDMPRCCSEQCLRELRRDRMDMEWKRKKVFDGTTCGRKGCSRPADGYLSDTRPCTASRSGWLWYGPICTKCCEKATNTKPSTLLSIWEQRNGVDDMAELFNVPIKDMEARLQAAGAWSADPPSAPSGEMQHPDPEMQQHDDEPNQVIDLAPSPNERVQHADTEAKDLQELSDQFQILTQDDFELASVVINEANSRRKALEVEKKKISGPAKAIIDAANALFNPVINRLKGIEDDLKEKVGLAQLAVQAQQQQAVFAAQAAAARGDMVGASQAMHNARTSELQTPEGLRLSDKWEVEVTNVLELDRQYLMADMKKLRAAVKAGHRQINGARIFQKPGVAAVGKA